MSLTVEQIKVRTTHERVSALSDTQIQALLDACERILKGLGLNTSATDYTAIFEVAEYMLFDWYVSNPSNLKSLEQGRLIEIYNADIPRSVLIVLSPVRSGGLGTLSRPGGR